MGPTVNPNETYRTRLFEQDVPAETIDVGIVFLDDDEIGSTSIHLFIVLIYTTLVREFTMISCLLLFIFFETQIAAVSRQLSPFLIGKQSG